MTPQFWLNLQVMYDLEAEQSQENKRAMYAGIHACNEEAALTAQRGR
jgi:plasmid maintenance system antidote protein VapI